MKTYANLSVKARSERAKAAARRHRRLLHTKAQSQQMPIQIDDSIRIGRAFRAVRTAHGVSLLEVSKAVGLKSISGWSRVETGETAMTVKQLFAACKCIGRDPCDIIKLASQL